MNCCTSAFHSETHTHKNPLTFCPHVDRETPGPRSQVDSLRAGRKTVKTNLVSQLWLSQRLFPASAGLQLSSSANFRSHRTKDKNCLVWSRSISHDFEFILQMEWAFFHFPFTFYIITEGTLMAIRNMYVLKV